VTSSCLCKQAESVVLPLLVESVKDGIQLYALTDGHHRRATSGRANREIGVPGARRATATADKSLPLVRQHRYCTGCEYSPDSVLRGLQVEPAPGAHRRHIFPANLSPLPPIRPWLSHSLCRAVALAAFPTQGTIPARLAAPQTSAGRVPDANCAVGSIALSEKC